MADPRPLAAVKPPLAGELGEPTDEETSVEPELLDAIDPATASPLEVASGFPLASEAAIVTSPGVEAVPPITSAPCTM